MTPARQVATAERGLTWPMVIVVLALVAALALAWWSLQSNRHVATVNGQGITPHELATTMRAELWKRGLAWATMTPQDQSSLRDQALNSLIDSRLVAQLPVKPSPHRAEETFQQFIKQFDSDEAWRTRVAAQGMDEVKLRQSLAAGADRVDAVEALVTVGGSVPEAEAEAWYQKHKSTCMIPERVRASHFFLSGHDAEKPEREPEMLEFHRQLTAQETTLAALSAKFSEDERSKKKSGQLGWFSRDRVPKDFADKVFSLTPGTLSPPFQTRLGWHIMLVHQKLPARQATFKEMLPEISALLETQQRTRKLDELLAALRAKAQIKRNDAILPAVQPAP